MRGRMFTVATIGCLFAASLLASPQQSAPESSQAPAQPAQAPAQPSQAPVETQTLPKLKTSRPATTGWKPADSSDAQAEVSPETAGESATIEVPTGTRIPLSLINSVSTRSAAPGDRVYLETTFPIFANGKLVIPPGSYVLGTITSSKRPGRVKGKGEMHLRFDSVTLPNGVTRDFRARVGGLDGGLREGLDREEGTIKGDSDKGGDAMTAVGTTISGGSLGTMGGLAAGNVGRGAGIGLAGGAAAGVATMLLTRGPDVVLPSGTNLELVTDRPLVFTVEEVKFEGMMNRSVIRTAPAPTVNQQRQSPWGRNGIPGVGGPF